MSFDVRLRELERQWRAGDAQAALAYCHLLDRKNGRRPTELLPLEWKACKFNGRRQANCSEAELPGGRVLQSYETVVAVWYGYTNQVFYAPDRIPSVTTLRHVRRWAEHFPEVACSEAELDFYIEELRSNRAWRAGEYCPGAQA